MLSPSHSKRSKLERRAKRTPASKGMPTLTSEYNAADDLVEQVYVDIANGGARSQIIKKLMEGVYKNQKKKYAARTAACYYNAALDRFAVDTDIEMEKLRNLFYGRYEGILEECIKTGDMYNARCTLDSMAKIFLGVDKKENKIEINNNAEGITIKFGFSNDKEEDNAQEAEYEEVNGD